MFYGIGAGDAIEVSEIADEQSDEDDSIEVAFDSGGKRYRRRFEPQCDWFDVAGVQEMMNEALAEGGSPLRFQTATRPRPDRDQTGHDVLCAPEMYAKAVEAGLIPTQDALVGGDPG